MQGGCGEYTANYFLFMHSRKNLAKHHSQISTEYSICWTEFYNILSVIMKFWKYSTRCRHSGVSIGKNIFPKGMMKLQASHGEDLYFWIWSTKMVPWTSYFLFSKIYSLDWGVRFGQFLLWAYVYYVFWFLNCSVQSIEIDSLEYQQTEKIETELKDVDRIRAYRCTQLCPGCPSGASIHTIPYSITPLPTAPFKNTSQMESYVKDNPAAPSPCQIREF
jgi:hypothetical protein